MIKLLFFPRYLIRLYLQKTEIERLLLIAVLFSTIMLAVRVVFTGTITFVSLEWNLFLAFIPYFITQLMPVNHGVMERNWKFAGIFLMWLVFIPNSFYILTDLFHLQENNNAPLWFDLLLILSFAWNGVLVGILSIRQMEKAVFTVFGKRNELFFLYPIMWMNAFGIYIGRYLRFNSWDIIINPFLLMNDIITLITHPILYKEAWGMVFFYSFFLSILYLTVKKLSRMRFAF